MSAYRIEYGLSVEVFDMLRSAKTRLASLKRSAWLYRVGEAMPIGQTIVKDNRWESMVWGERVKPILLVGA